VAEGAFDGHRAQLAAGIRGHRVGDHTVQRPSPAIRLLTEGQRADDLRGVTLAEVGVREQRHGPPGLDADQRDRRQDDCMGTESPGSVQPQMHNLAMISPRRGRSSAL
jgi:hypothetical protein